MKPFQITTVIILAVLAALGSFLLYNVVVQKNVSPSPDTPPKTEQKAKVKLYYYNPSLDTDDSGNLLCSPQGLVSVDREIPETDSAIQGTIELLLSGGLTDSEKADGLTTEYPLPGFELLASELSQGVLTLKFTDPQNRTVGGSCRVSVLWQQIEATAKQFAGVNQVKFEPEDLFQP